MKKQLFLVFALLSFGFSVSAQKEYKLAKSSGRLNLNISGAIIEGYNGKEIIFTAPVSKDAEEDERAKGLRPISASGFSDNTGLGIEVTEKGDEVNVNSVSKKTEGIITIKVPQEMKVVISNSSNLYHTDISLKNLKNEIEVATSYNKIRLENNTGPMNIKSLYGTVDAIFTGEIKGPVSIVSVYGYVDVTMPTSTKANIELGSSRGNLYAAESFKIAIDKPAEKANDKGIAKAIDKGTVKASDKTGEKTTSTGVFDSVLGTTTVNVNGSNVVLSRVNGLDMNSASAISSVTNRLNARGITINTYGAGRDMESIKGKLNGGGSDLVFKSNYQNVYLRTK
jgi:hypothetical protein